VDKEIIYAGDPLCAWCFGFTDIFTSIQETFRNSIRFSYVMGGLKVGSSIPICAKIKERIQANWATVVHRTGQAIAVDKIEALPEGDYNSEPPCRAVVTVRTLDHDLGFAYYKAVHRAFYLDMKNISDPICLCELARDMGIADTIFFDLFHSDSVREATLRDFERSKKAGVLGLPALILKDGTGVRVLNQGFKPLAQLEEAIQSWVDGHAAPLLF
jgi:putative protein-disulfide isomerase